MKDEIRDYVLSHAAGAEIGDLADDESLLEAGVIDSTAMIELIDFLESSYKISVSEDDMVPENFDSIAAIVAYVNSKRAES